MFSGFVYLKEHNILLITRKKESAFPNNPTRNDILELIEKNRLFKLILDYRDPDFALTKKDIVAFSKYFQQSGDAF
ncbi:MAG: hypothetical protein APR54_03470 [Candidatus Cloacimonas sp. SDB]|nr:MAG: hypothetical protein APR54_03470 [Candidatus Cloacimonas sp. SDB]